MKPVVVLFLIASLLFLLETPLAKKHKFKCPCVEEAKNGYVYNNVGFYFISMMTDGSKNRCSWIEIENKEPSKEPGRRKVPEEALIGKQDDGENGMGKTGIQSANITLGNHQGEEKVVETGQYRYDDRRFLILERDEKKRLFLTSILAQDNDLNTGYVLEFSCEVTTGKKHIVLKSRTPKPDKKVIDLAKKKAKELGVGIEKVEHDDKCDNEKKIWSELQKKKLNS